MRTSDHLSLDYFLNNIFDNTKDIVSVKHSILKSLIELSIHEAPSIAPLLTFTSSTINHGQNLFTQQAVFSYIKINGYLVSMPFVFNTEQCIICNILSNESITPKDKIDDFSTQLFDKMLSMMASKKELDESQKLLDSYNSSTNQDKEIISPFKRTQKQSPIFNKINFLTQVILSIRELIASNIDNVTIHNHEQSITNLLPAIKDDNESEITTNTAKNSFHMSIMQTAHEKHLLVGSIYVGSISTVNESTIFASSIQDPVFLSLMSGYNSNPLTRLIAEHQYQPHSDITTNKVIEYHNSLLSNLITLPYCSKEDISNKINYCKYLTRAAERSTYESFLMVYPELRTACTNTVNGSIFRRLLGNNTVLSFTSENTDVFAAISYYLLDENNPQPQENAKMTEIMRPYKEKWSNESFKTTIARTVNALVSCTPIEGDGPVFSLSLKNDLDNFHNIIINQYADVTKSIRIIRAEYQTKIVLDNVDTTSYLQIMKYKEESKAANEKIHALEQELEYVKSMSRTEQERSDAKIKDIEAQNSELATQLEETSSILQSSYEMILSFVTTPNVINTVDNALLHKINEAGIFSSLDSESPLLALLSERGITVSIAAESDDDNSDDLDSEIDEDENSSKHTISK